MSDEYLPQRGAQRDETLFTESTTDEHAPPGWDKNPSRLSKRLPLLGLGIVGFVVASYLAAYQLDIIHTVWDPFFGDGTKTVLTSKLSESLPVPDALLGAIAYLAEVLTDGFGSERRWHRRPWIVLLFGLVVLGLGLTSIVLAIIQPVLYDWCTLCLVSAAISVTIFGPATDEVLATLQYLRWAHDEGHSLALAVWKGTRVTPMMSADERGEGR